MRQYLTTVNAAADMSVAETTGAQIYSRQLSFVPGEVEGVNHHLRIGAARGCKLILQSILSDMLNTNQESSIPVCGGKINILSLPLHFLLHAFIT
jgi:RNA 3'-terminal phosphate cyclase (ATP)